MAVFVINFQEMGIFELKLTWKCTIGLLKAQELIKSFL